MKINYQPGLSQGCRNQLTLTQGTDTLVSSLSIQRFWVSSMKRVGAVILTLEDQQMLSTKAPGFPRSSLLKIHPHVPDCHLSTALLSAEF